MKSVSYTHLDVYKRQVQKPVTADEDVPFFLIQFAEKVIDGRPKCQIIHAACGVVRRRDALLHFRTELTDKSIALQAAADVYKRQAPM